MLTYELTNKITSSLLSCPVVVPEFDIIFFLLQNKWLKLKCLTTLLSELNTLGYL